MRAAPLLALAVLLAGCVGPGVNPGGPEACDEATDSLFLLGEAGTSEIPPGGNKSLLVDVHNCSGTASFVLDRVAGGAGNCVFDFVVVDLVQGDRTWDVPRGENGSAEAPPPFPPPCPAVPDQNTSIPPQGDYRATFGWNGTLSRTACATDANGTRCDGRATFEPAPPGAYEIVARARVNGHDVRRTTNVTVVAPGLRVLGADYHETYASPLDAKSVRAALSDMGYTVEAPVNGDVGRVQDACADVRTCPVIAYGQRLWNGSPAVNVSLPSRDATNFGEDAAAAQAAGDALCRELRANATALLSDLDARVGATPSAPVTCVARIGEEP